MYYMEKEPNCTGCGRPVSKCVCPPNDEDEDDDGWDEEEDWGAGEADFE